MNTKLGQPHFQIFFKPNIFLLEKCTQSILLVQIEITPWTKAFEPWSHPKSRGTIRFPKPSSVNSPKDPQGTGTFPKCRAGPHSTLKNCKHEHCENWSLDVVQSVTKPLMFLMGDFWSGKVCTQSVSSRSSAAVLAAHNTPKSTKTNQTGMMCSILL